MKIVVVSALYPPNFIGGATVQAQRLARGFASKGHDVRVFAGALDHDREPLERWDEVDEFGLRVSWLATTPWFGFGDEKNHDNPEAAAVFAAWLGAEPADIVHAHALQGLGSGIVTAASDLGAKVVVTMHDWWWLCARQFLADREFRPCCPVVDAGGCACEVDRPWLNARTHLMRERFERADLILAPSQIAVTSLIANGVDPMTIEVDENGLPAADTPSRRASASRTGDQVRFMFAGGSHEMKGVKVLTDAVTHLEGHPGWSLDMFGSLEFVEGRSVVLDQRVKIQPPFDPADIGEVLSSHDILIVPSVMRESHSLITREALSHGVPVICSDSWGPQEVVRHGINGLVFPSGDPLALAESMRRVIDEPGCLDKLKAGCTAVPVRPIDSQVDGLMSRYERLLKEPDRQGAPSPVGRVLFVSGIEGAPLRYRATLPAEALGLLGIKSQVRHYQDPELEELSEWADTIVMYRVPATKRIMGLLADARQRFVPLVFDVDDLIFDPKVKDEIPALKILPSFEANKWLEGIHRYRLVMEACDVYAGSTKLLCDYAESRVGVPARRFPNGVGLRLSRISDHALRTPRSEGPPRLAYLSGTRTHDHDWAMIEPAVMRALERVPDAELWMVGLLPMTKAMQSLGPRLRKVKMQPWDELPPLLRQIDVNLAPLEPGTFNEAKSAIKWLEAALVEVPTIASSTEPFREAITHGEDGILASTPEEWEEAIVDLLSNRSERVRLGTAARRDVLFRWSPWIQARLYRSILEEAHDLVAKGVRPRLVDPLKPSRSIVHNEPTRPHPLEPYDLTIAFHRVATAMPTDTMDFGGNLSFDLLGPRDGLARVDLLIAAYGKKSAPLRIEVIDASTGETLRTSEAKKEQIRDRSWVAFEFEPIVDSSKRVIRIKVTVHGNDAASGSSGIALGSSGIALWSHATGTHTINGRSKPGGPCIRAWATPSEEAPNEPVPEEPVALSQKLRARARYAIYILRTGGIRGLASWIVRAVYLRTYGRQRD